MRINTWLKTVTAIGVFAFAPSFCRATAFSCDTVSVTSESFSPSYALRANTELQDMQRDAQRIAEQASINRTPTRADIDDLGMRLQWLESVEALITPAQRQATCEAAPLVQSMADGSTDNLTATAAALEETIASNERVAKQEEHASYLQRNLGMLEVFGK